MLLTLAAQNLKFGGLQDDDGHPEDRWPLLAERFNSISPKPDFLLLTEARDWEKQGHRPLSRAMHDLDMDALPLAPSKSGQHAALLYNRSTVGRWQRWNTGYTQEVTQSFGVAAFDVGLPSLLSIVPVHLDPFRAEKALQEAFLVSSRAYRHGPFAIIGGDINYPPAQGPDPDYSKMRPYNLASRTALTPPNTPFKPDRRIGWALQKAGYIDVAYEMFEKTGEDRFLEKTASDDRIDQFWVSKPLQSAIVNYWTLAIPAGGSDHQAVIMQLDTDKIDFDTSWQYD